MAEIRATFRLTTPMFCGGAGPQAELRAPSFKGVLRFWWRACAWPRLGGDLGQIRREEEHIFGGPDTGQSRVAIRLAPIGDMRAVAPPAVLTAAAHRDGARYLGYGVMHSAASKKKQVRAAELIRGCLTPPLTITAALRLRGLSEQQRGLLAEALCALGTLGGMGSRSRRGYGSLSLVSIEGDVEAKRVTTLDDLRTRVGALRPPTPDQIPAYTALSPGSRFLIGPPTATEAMGVLDRLGQEYRQFRQSDRLAGDAEVVLRGRPAGEYPRRVAFGLPINYGETRPVVAPAAVHDRRASPLFFHIHQCGQQAVAVISFLPASFLPRPQRIAWSHGRGGDRRERRDLPAQPDALYRPVTAFLDHLERDSQFTTLGEEQR